VLTYSNQGQVLHYRVSGRDHGPTLAFANSLGTDMRIWNRIAPAFENDYRILCYDKRGHGLSSAPNAPYTMDEHISDLAALLDLIGAGQEVIVCGDSVGGLIAQGLAAAEPDRVMGLVLCDTAARIGTDEMWNERIQMARQGGVEALADATMQRWFPPEFHAQRAVELEMWRNMMARTPLEGFVGTMEAIRDTDFTRSSAELEIPVLAVAGEHDGSTPVPVVREMASLFKRCHFEVIPGAGHLPCIDQPEALLRLMQDFLAR